MGDRGSTCIARFSLLKASALCWLSVMQSYKPAPVPSLGFDRAAHASKTIVSTHSLHSICIFSFLVHCCERATT